MGEEIYDKFSTKNKITGKSKTTDEVKGNQIIKPLQKEQGETDKYKYVK